MPDITDATLLERFRAGDEQALDKLFARYEAPLLQFLVGVLHNHHQAEDVLQETFLRALEHLNGVDPAHLRGWLFTVAHQQAMLARRKQKCRFAESLIASASLADRTPSPELQAELEDEACRLRKLLDRLPLSQREVIRQRVYEGKRFREIAASLDCPLSTALARMHEGLKRLRHLWENELPV